MRAAGLSICGTLGVLAVCVVLTPAAASALEPGVHLDPGSPAEKQYVLTLNQARQTGQGSSKPSHSGNSGSSSPLFGSGITPPGGGAGAPQSSSGRGSGTAHGVVGSAPAKGKGAGSGTHPRATPVPVTLPPSVLHDTHSQDSGGDGSLLALLGGGLAILVLGGFGGTVLRHSRRPTPSG